MNSYYQIYVSICTYVCSNHRIHPSLPRQQKRSRSKKSMQSAEDKEEVI